MAVRYPSGILAQFDTNLALVTNASSPDGVFVKSAYRFTLDKEPDSSPDGLYFLDVTDITPRERYWGTGENISEFNVTVRVGYFRGGGDLGASDRQSIARNAADDSQRIADVLENPLNYNPDVTGIRRVMYTGTARVENLRHGEIWETRFLVEWRTDLATTPVVDLSAGASISTVAAVNTGSSTKLSTLDASSMTEGAIAFVQSQQSYYQLKTTDTADLTVDHVTVETASGLANAVWTRLPTRSLYWENEPAWTVDPINGSDDSASTTVKTLSEVARRLFQAILDSTVTVTVLSDTPPTDIVTWTARPAATSGTIQLVINGTPTVVYSGTVTGTTAIGALPSTGEDTLTDSAIPVSFTASGLIGDGLIYKRTNGAARYFYAAADKGSKTIRVSRPMDSTGNFGVSSLVIGDTYSVLRLPKIYDHRFVGAEGQAVRLVGGVSTGFVVYNFLDILATSPMIVTDSVHNNCCTFGSNAKTSNSYFYNCAFYETSNGGFGFGFGGSGIVNVAGGMMFGPGNWLYQFNQGQIVIFSTSPTLMQGCGLNFNASRNAAGAWAFYDCTAAQLISVSTAAQLVFHTISGSGNTGKIIGVLHAGCRAYYVTSPPANAGTTSDPNPYQVGSSSFNSLPQMASFATGDIGIMAQAVP